MKKVFVALTVWLVSASAFAQGTIQFNNRITGRVDAPVACGLTGMGYGAFPGAQAQLFLVSGARFTALSPATTFRTSSAAAMPYVVEPSEPVVVPGVQAGEQATIVMRAWFGAQSYDAALPQSRTQSNPITITLGGVPPDGGAPMVPAVLTGLGFVIPLGSVCVPEPSQITLALLGAVALLARHRRKFRRSSEVASASAVSEHWSN